MSRCFPFPPTGFAGKSNDALIVSIKLQEEKQISIPDRVTEKVKSSHKKKDRKSDRKDKKKDRKEKKRDSKEKIQSHVTSEKQKQPQIVKLYQVESKGKEVLSEVVEQRSNLTEEHGMPIEPQHVFCSSDSTGNSGKRKRHSSPDNSIQGNGGNKRQIRLSSFKNKAGPSTSQVLPSPSVGQKSQVLPSPSVSQSDAVLKLQVPVRAPNAASQVLPSPSVSQSDAVLKLQESVRAPNAASQVLPSPSVSQSDAVLKLQESVRAPNAAPQLGFPDKIKLQTLSKEPSVGQSDAMLKLQGPVRAPNAAPQLGFPAKIKLQTPSKEPSTSGRVESKEPVKKLSSHERKMIKKDKLYNNLIQNLVPPTAMMELLVDKDDEEDWWLGKRDEQRPPKKLKESDDLPCSVFASLQPGAHFLSDVGVYALPFTVPF